MIRKRSSRPQFNIAVLLVDDEPMILRTLGRILRRFTTTVHLAADGLEALEVMQSHSVDLVITDLQMPRMTGIQLLERVVGMERPPRCVMATAYNVDGYGAPPRSDIEVLVKPVGVVDIVRILESVGPRAEAS